TDDPRPSRPWNLMNMLATDPEPPFEPAGTSKTEKVATLLPRMPLATLPAGTSTAVPMVNGPPRFPVTVYDWTVMLSRAVGAVTVGFLRLLRSVTHAVVVELWEVEDGTLDTKFPGVSEKPSTLRNVKALPL